MSAASVSVRPPEDLDNEFGAVALGARDNPPELSGADSTPKGWMPVVMELDVADGEPAAPIANVITSPASKMHDPVEVQAEDQLTNQPAESVSAKPSTPDDGTPSTEDNEQRSEAPPPPPEEPERLPDSVGGNDEPPRPPRPPEQPFKDDGNADDNDPSLSQVFWPEHFVVTKSPAHFMREEAAGRRKLAEAVPSKAKVTEPDQKVPLYDFKNVPDAEEGFAPSTYPQVHIVFTQAGARPKQEDYRAFRRADTILYDPRVAIPSQEDMPDSLNGSPISLGAIGPPLSLANREVQAYQTLHEAIRAGAPADVIRDHATEAARAKVGADNACAHAFAEQFQQLNREYIFCNLGIVTDISQASVVKEIDRTLKPFPLRVRTIVDDSVAGMPTPQVSALEHAAHHLRSAGGYITRTEVPRPLLDRVVLEQTITAFEPSPKTDEPQAGLRPAQRAVLGLSDKAVQLALGRIEQLKTDRLPVVGRGVAYLQLRRFARQFIEPAN